MKKLCLIMTVVFILSSLSVINVFAELSDDLTLSTGDDAQIFTYDGTSFSSSLTGFNKYNGSTYSGLTQEKDVIGVQRQDSVYHVSGTSTVSDTGHWKYCFRPTPKTTGDSLNRKNYIVSFDIFSNKEYADTEIFVRVGLVNGTVVDLNLSTYGLEKEKWQHVVINATPNISPTPKEGTANVSVYVNGEKKGIDVTLNLSTTKTDDASKYLTLDARLTANFVIDKEYDFYFDNFKAIASDNAYTPKSCATINSISDDIATINDDNSVDVKNNTTASDFINGVTISDNSTISIYRALTSDTGLFNQVEDTDTIKKDDLIVLTNDEGTVSYYSVKNIVYGTDFTVQLPVITGEVKRASTINATSNLNLQSVADKNVTLVFTLYNGITLVEMKTDSILENESVTKNLTASINVPDESGNYYAKAFLWDSLNGMNNIEIE